MPGFRYALANRGGEVFDEVECGVSNMQPGDEIRGAGNVRFRVTAVIPLPTIGEFVDDASWGLLEVEPLS